MADKKEKVVVITPTYNEAGNIKEHIRRLEEVFKTLDPKWDMQILVVDDTSPDGTAEIVKKLQKTHKNLHLYLNTEKVGLGGAYMKGMRYAIEKLKCDLMFQMDADLQHDHSLIPQFLEKIEDGADMVVGSRYMKGGSIPKNWGFMRKVLSVGGNLFIRTMMLDNSIHDWTTGFRAVRPWVYEKVHGYITELKTYSFQISFLYWAKKEKAKLAEVPLNFKERTAGESKLPGIQGTIQTFWFVIKMRSLDLLHSRFFKFAVVGGTGFVINLVALEVFRRLPVSSGLASLFESLKKTKIVNVFAQPAFWATALATELAIISNFVLNNIWTFKEKKITKIGEWLVSFLKFNGTSMGALVIQSVVVGGGVILLGDTSLVRSASLAFAVAFLVLPYNYAMYNLFIWKTWKLFGKKK